MSILDKNPEGQIEDLAQELESELDHAWAELRSAEREYDKLYDDYLSELTKRSDLETSLRTICALVDIDPSDL